MDMELNFSSDDNMGSDVLEFYCCISHSEGLGVCVAFVNKGYQLGEFLSDSCMLSRHKD